MRKAVLDASSARLLDDTSVILNSLLKDGCDAPHGILTGCVPLSSSLFSLLVALRLLLWLNRQGMF